MKGKPKLWKRAVGMAAAALMSLTLLPASAFAYYGGDWQDGKEIDYSSVYMTDAEIPDDAVVYVSISQDGAFFTSDGQTSGEILAYVPVSIKKAAAVDLDAYGLGAYKYPCIDKGNNLSGYYVTLLQVMIHAAETYYSEGWNCVVDGDFGSFHFNGGFFGWDDNLTYYANGEYPLQTAGRGTTCDHIIVQPGDFYDIGMFTNRDYYADPAAGYQYFTDASGNITHGYDAAEDTALQVSLKKAMVDGDIMDPENPGQILEPGSYETNLTTIDNVVYYGTSLYDENAQCIETEGGSASIVFEEPGTYYLWTEGQTGSTVDAVVSAPAYAVVTVQESAPVVTANVTVRAQVESEYADTFSEPLFVKSDLAEAYGYVDEVVGAVSVLDAAVAEHQHMFGDDFTPDSAREYLDVNATGTTTKIFGISTYANGFFVNEGFPNDGTESPWGGYNGTLINTTPIYEGDVVDLFIYSDTSYWCDYYTFITAESDTVAAGEALSATVKGVMAMNGYLYRTPEDYRAAAAPMEDIGFVWISKATGDVTQTQAFSDEDGAAMVTAPDEAGVYYLAAVSSDFEDIIKNPIEINVICTANVTVRAQVESEYADTFSEPLFVKSDLAEAYGYVDEVVGAVSVLDAAVAEHQHMFGDDFTPDSAREYLDVNATGTTTKIFGISTYANGFFVNEGFPNDGTESPWGGYNGTLINTTPIYEGDVVDLFIYSDTSYWCDYYTFITAESDTVAAGEALSATVKGVMAMNGYLYRTPEDYRAAAAPMEDIGFVWISKATGDVTQTQAFSDEDGAAMVTAPDAAGVYYLAAVSSDFEDVIKNPIEVTVTEAEFKIIKQPENTNAKIGEGVSYSVTALKADSYQWYYSKDGGKKWYKSAMEGNDTDNITGTVKSNNIGNIYRCKVTGEDGTVLYSESAGNEIQRLSITKQPESVEAKIGDTVVYSIAAENAESYQWYYSKDGGEKWYKSSAAGAGGTELSVKLKSSTVNNLYRCKVTGEDGTSVTSESAHVYQS